MSNTWFVVRKLIAALIFILALSFMGMATGKPVMILAYAGFFVVMMFIVFLFVKRNQRHFEIISEQNQTIKKLTGFVITVIAVIAPALAISNVTVFDMGDAKPGFGLFAIVLGITIAMIAGGIFAVRMINTNLSNKAKKAIGYVIIVLLSAVPALLVMRHDRTTTGIGSVYYIALIDTILSWWGITLYLNKE
jgi:hypothetical protein